MADRLTVDGVTFDVPDEDDWELGELAEFGRLRDKWGDMGATIALVWIVKHRADASFTVEQAERVKVGQVDHQEELEDDAVPLGTVETRGSSSSERKPESSPDASLTPDGSGAQ